MTTTPVPETIGRYRVLRPLGAGAMGAVYLAEDPLLKRRVAVKVVQMAGGAVDQARQRFAREAEISARLNHPNVITIYDVGEDPQCGPFLAMEFVDGSSLAEVIKAGGLDDAARLRILVLAMQGLEAAHVAGIVHRDVKPSNLMIGGDGRVKLMDFGIARDEDVGMTATGAVIGTPAYIAPEQLKGLPPSTVTDRYAFAVSAFELFTGARPFHADTASAMLFAIVNDPPLIPPSMRPALGQAFERALAKNPSERPATLRAFLDQLIAGAALHGTIRARVQALLDAASPPPTAAAATAAEATALLDAAVTAKAAATTVTERGTAAPATAEPAGLAPGIGLGPILGVGGGLALAAGLAAWFLLAGRESPEPAPPVVVAQVATPVPVAPTARPAPTERPPTPAPEATVQPTAAPAASATPAPVAEPTVVEPASIARLQTHFITPPTPMTPSLTPREFEALVRRELSRRDLTHVLVRVDKEHRVRLANLTDRSEEREARSAVTAAAPELRVVATEVRRAPEPTAAPSWGTIRSEGAERSE